MLRLDRLGKAYPAPHGQLVVLRDITLDLAPGEAVAIMGPSGSGKSTLLNICGALEPPTSGTLTLADTNPFTLPARELARFRNEQVGFVFQEHHLLPQLTLLENVLLPTLVHPRDNTTATARDLLARVGLADRLDHRPAELSGGERQRGALARALINRPRLVLADEPTGNLDADTASTVADLLLELQSASQFILIVVTHSSELAARFQRRLSLHGKTLEPAEHP